MSDEVPQEFADIPDDVKAKILEKTGQEALRPEDVQTYFGGEEVVSTEGDSGSATDVPEITGGGES
jgi:hypothetical protein